MENSYIEIELVNDADVALASKGYLKDGDVKQLCVNAIVETKGFSCIINESVQACLQLPVIDKRLVQIGEKIVECEIAGMLGIRFKNKKGTCSALILPGNANIQISEAQWQFMSSTTVKLPTVFPVLAS